VLGDVAAVNHPYYKRFLTDASNEFEQVLVVPGNHEYYGSSRSRGNEILADLCRSFRNVTLLNSDKSSSTVLRFSDVLYGLTYPRTSVDGGDKVADYRYILDDSETESISVGDTNRWHLEDVNWLRESLSSLQHPPSY